MELKMMYRRAAIFQLQGLKIQGLFKWILESRKLIFPVSEEVQPLETHQNDSQLL